MTKRPEVLAPAGDRTAMEAAVRAGADAVYFGLQGFNARARATNFDTAELAQTMQWLHEHGARGYVTLNTLVFDDELPSVEAAVRACAEAGVDAVIVQDLGVAKLVRAIAPTLPIHASTQMTCTDASSVDFARELGASRVILARELSLEDIAKIRATTDAELEVFVHGALCISYSGQCLTSEAIGGRSANRGACAQACRLPYELVVDGVLQDTKDRAYLLSPEDLESSSLVPELMKLGVGSLKIEGRLKGPEYVAATTRLYKDAIARAGTMDSSNEELRRHALQTFTRGSGPGFLGGVDHQRLVEGRACDHRGVLAGTLVRLEKRAGKTWLVVAPVDDDHADLAAGDGILVEGERASEGELGGRVWLIERDGGEDGDPRARRDRRDRHEARLWLGPDVDPRDALIGHRVFRTSAPAVEKRIRADVPAEKKLGLALRIAGATGEPFVLEGRTTTGGHARVTGDAKIENARSTPLDEATLREKLGALGETSFVLTDLEVALPPNVIVPVSSLKRARRALVDALRGALATRHETTSATYTDLIEQAVVPDRGVHPSEQGSPATDTRSPSRQASGGLFVLCRTTEQALAAIDAGADGVYLDFLELTGTGEALRLLRAKGAWVGVAPPRIRKPGEEKIDRYIASLAPDAVLVRGLGALREIGAKRSSEASGAANARPIAIGDFSLNVTNRITASEVLARGLDAFTPSFDLDGSQLVALLGSGFGPFAEVVVHHPMALFHMEHCVIAALLSSGSDYRTCGRPCEKHRVSLRDRAGMDHPVEADVGCRNTVFHARAQSAVQLAPRLAEAGVRRYRIELVRETASDVARLVTAYQRVREHPSSATHVWRELRTEAGYGVVKGSLRVVS